MAKQALALVEVLKWVPFLCLGVTRWLKLMKERKPKMSKLTKEERENAKERTRIRELQKIIITREKLKEYFSVFYTKYQVEKVLFDLLGEWKKMNVQ